MKYEVKLNGENPFEAQYVTIGDYWIGVRRGPSEDKYYYPARRVSYVKEIRIDPRSGSDDLTPEILEGVVKDGL